jgi:hypothetical protein
MSAYEGDRVHVGAMIRGYGHAHQRYVRASEGDSLETPYYALFESLNWAVALDEVVGEIWRPEGRKLEYEWRTLIEGAEIMPGVRLARNLIHHHWARAPKIEFTNGRRGWTWPDADTLPPPTRRFDMASVPVYVEHMQGVAVADTLHSIGAMFEHVGVFLGAP